MPNTLPFEFIELHGLSGKEKYTVLSTGQSAQRVFRGPWLNRQDFISSLVPGISEADGEITFSDPGVYPDIPNLIAVTANVEGAGKSFCDGVDGMIRYEDCIVTVDYEYLTGSQGLPGQTIPSFPQFIQVSANITQQILTWQKEEAKVDPNDPFGGPVNPLKEFIKVLPLWNILLKVLFHPNPKLNVASNLSGKVNNKAFIFPKINLNCSEESILFHGVDINEKAFINGVTLFELDYKFTYRPGTSEGNVHFPNWNELYNRDGTIVRVVQLNNQPNYKQGDFNTLFNTAVPEP